MRRFDLIRDEDESGVSGVGPVAEGVVFGDGTCALRWTTYYRSTGIYESLNVLVQVHGHKAKTRVVFIDAPVAGEAMGDAPSTSSPQRSKPQSRPAPTSSEAPR